MVQNPTDATLVLAVRAGDIAAYEIFVRRYETKLLRFAMRYVRSHHIAEEIVQDALFSFYLTIDRVDVSKKVSSYLYAITKNKAVSVLRSLRNTVSLSHVDLPSDMDLYDLTEKNERADILHKALHNLPVLYARVLRLYYFDELSYKEISKKLRMPINTIRTHLLRAKKVLRKGVVV